MTEKADLVMEIEERYLVIKRNKIDGHLLEQSPLYDDMKLSFVVLYILCEGSSFPILLSHFFFLLLLSGFSVPDA